MTQQQRDALDKTFTPPTDDVPDTRSPAEMRKGFAGFMGTMKITPGVSQAETTLGGRRTVRVERDGNPTPGTLLYFHGGSYVVGSPETAMSLTSALVARTGMRALSVDYRLGPEHPFPAAFDDALAAYRELLATTPASQIAFVGDSAGGGISVGVCFAVRDAGLPMPACIVAFSPGLDLTRTGASMDSKAGIDPFFTRARMAYTQSWFLGDANPAQPQLSPATCGEFAGFPPVLLQVGTNELLLDDSTRFAARAWAANVDVILDVTANVPHVFQSYTLAGVLDEADQALDRAALFLSQHLA